MSMQFQREVAVPCATALGHPCLVSFLCHHYIPHFLIRRIFYLLVSFPFFYCIHMEINLFYKLVIICFGELLSCDISVPSFIVISNIQTYIA